MENMEDKINSILGNPEMMQKIMAMAQSMGGGTATPPPPQPESPVDGPMLPNLDLATIQKISGFIGKTSIDRNQRALLAALAPYLSTERIRKLENAMRASKLAGVAALALGQQGNHLP